MRPLQDHLVLDFSQFLAGPSAAMRMADLGARVIKIERPQTGDICRQLYISNQKIGDDSTLFHSINRNKEGYSADLKQDADKDKILNLIRQADVLIHNFRPGVMERIGLDYPTVAELNPGLVYGTVSGYGDNGPWAGKPGQDLLAQAISGLAWLSGDAPEDGSLGNPTPMGLSVADLAASAHLVQGILACLVRRGKTGSGGLVQVSLLESILDLQFELFTTHLNDGEQPPRRSAINNANAYLGAPYGIYATNDGHIALAMGSIGKLAKLLDCTDLAPYSDPDTWFSHRDTIKSILARHLIQNSTRYWLDILEPEDIWCAEVLTWKQLRQKEGYKALQMEQNVTCPNGEILHTLRSPIRIDGNIYTSTMGAPAIGQDNHNINKEFNL